jgi:zinc transport system substrate-binding protein
MSLCFAALAAVCLTACDRAEPAGAPGQGGEALSAFVTIPPQAKFVERVVGQHVEVDVLVEPGHSPHTYEPTPSQMVRLAEADVYFLIGVPFEQILQNKIQSANPDMQMVDTGAGIELRRMKAHVHETEHAEHHSEDEGQRDPHIWLDPANVKVMGRNICDALVEMDPEHEEEYRSNLESFLADLDELDRDIRGITEALKTRKFMVFHPAFGYFADAYGLEQIPIEIEGKEPSARGLQSLIETARDEGIKVIFVQKQFSARSAEVVAGEIGGEVVEVDPLAREYFTGMRKLAQAFARAMR